MTATRTAAVGLGWVTIHRHLPTMEANPKFHVIGTVDPKPGLASEVSKKRHYPYSTEQDDLEDIPWFDEVDAVTIGACPFNHYKLIKSALSKGKHVLTEKPFAMTLEEGRELVSMAAGHGLTLAIVHNFQFANSTRRLIDDLECGRLGRIRGISAVQLGNPRRRLPVWYEGLPLGLFYDESPHFFYLLRRLSPGTLTFISAGVSPSTEGRVTPAGIHVHYGCDTADGRFIPVNMHLNFESPVSEWHLSVFGESALGDIDIFRDIYIRLPNDDAHTTGTAFRTSVSASWQHWAQHVTSGFKHLAGTLRYGNDVVFERFAAAVQTGTEPQGISAKDALAVLEMQHEVLSRHQQLSRVAK